MLKAVLGSGGQNELEIVDKVPGMKRENDAIQKQLIDDLLQSHFILYKRYFIGTVSFLISGQLCSSAVLNHI